MSSQRFHSLDALRAFALLLGVVFHSALSFVLPPGLWAVGVMEPVTIPALFVFYTHCFRMEIFFLMAGFFARLVTGKRGQRAFLKDRAVRIVLVFLVALYPMKLAFSALWVIGGKRTGWLQPLLPPEADGLPWWQLAAGGVAMESWPEINLTHLWFLYYLACITLLFLLARRLAMIVAKPESALSRLADLAFGRVISSRIAPLALMALTMPLLRSMSGFDIDTPDRGLAWHWPVLGLYGLFFSIGWLLHRHSELLPGFGRRWKVYLPLSLLFALAAATGAGLRMSGEPWTVEHTGMLRNAAVLATSLTMSFAVPGWLGLFVHFFERPRPWVRYCADSSYWIYLVHLPVVVALQIAMVHWAAPWWVKWPLVNLIAFPVLFLSYHGLVRRTWIGVWLNGRPRGQPSD